MLLCVCVCVCVCVADALSRSSTLKASLTENQSREFSPLSSRDSWLVTSIERGGVEEGLKYPLCGGSIERGGVGEEGLKYPLTVWGLHRERWGGGGIEIPTNCVGAPYHCLQPALCTGNNKR